ncbi:hypothetical protein I6L19_25125 (plasmid) [Escherichia coli]|nr:hypothetical protein I6L19_25125 [Escherichia coli]
MPSVSRYRTWLAVPADEIEDLKKAHPPMNGHTPVSLGQGPQTLVCPPGGGPVHAGPLAAPAAGSLHERQ